MTIEPDTKNWTWVLTRPCPDCGFDASSFPARDVSGALEENAIRWGELLQDPRAPVRPAPHIWSALEYGCHVRDVFRLFDRRVELMVAEDDPLFENWDQDVTAIESRYAEQDPKVVAEELNLAGSALAARLDGLSTSDWSRRGRRSDGAAFTVDTISRYLLHDPIHHLWDVERGFDSMTVFPPG